MADRGDPHPLPPADLFTLGHSTRSLELVVDMLRSANVELLVDIRTVPRSHRHPQFNLESLERELPALGIEYRHEARLGGFRRMRGDPSANGAWRNDSFHGFADYMQTPEFDQAIEDLVRLIAVSRLALMCSEAVPWRCHRSLVADALSVRGLRVVHLLAVGRGQPHHLTPFARVEGQRITYPPEA